MADSVISVVFYTGYAFYMIASLSDSMYCLHWLAFVGVRRMFSKSLSRSCHGVSVSDMLVEVPSV